MKPNNLRKLLAAGQPTIGTRVHNTWPAIVETIGHTGVFDYVEFMAEYAPFDLYALNNFCRAAELHNLGTVIKIDQDPRTFLGQRAIGAGFQGVLFADCRSPEEVQQCVKIARPDTPEDQGTYGVGFRRFTYMNYGGTPEYVEALREVVVMVMIEKRSAVDQLDEILAIKGVDMIQWGPADYAMSIGRAGETQSPEIKAVERKVIRAALKAGVQPRAEINRVDQARYYLDLGVRHFSLGIDLSILFEWWQKNGDQLRKVVADG
jgi:2-keto-3-deoxy-L-rhamnonate aldolase RhmA